MQICAGAGRGHGYQPQFHWEATQAEEGGGRRGRLELVSTAQQGSTLASGLPLLDPTCLARSKEGGKSCRFTHSAAALWAEIRLLVGADKMKSG